LILGIHPLIPFALRPKLKKKFENFLKQPTIVGKEKEYFSYSVYLAMEIVH